MGNGIHTLKLGELCFKEAKQFVSELISFSIHVFTIHAMHSNLDEMMEYAIRNLFIFILFAFRLEYKSGRTHPRWNNMLFPSVTIPGNTK